MTNLQKRWEIWCQKNEREITICQVWLFLLCTVYCGFWMKSYSDIYGQRTITFFVCQNENGSLVSSVNISVDEGSLKKFGRSLFVANVFWLIFVFFGMINLILKNFRMNFINYFFCVIMSWLYYGLFFYLTVHLVVGDIKDEFEKNVYVCLVTLIFSYFSMIIYFCKFKIYWDAKNFIINL